MDSKPIIFEVLIRSIFLYYRSSIRQATSIDHLKQNNFQNFSIPFVCIVKQSQFYLLLYIEEIEQSITNKDIQLYP
jgi:hypothetical protein